MTEVLGTEHLIDIDGYVRLLSRLGLDLGFASIVIVAVFYRLYRNRELVFTYFMLNVITFAICALFRKGTMELGLGLGLFAVFGILRYRTEPIRMRDLTYMFIVIAIAIMNAVANKKISIAELITVNVVIVVMAIGIELYPRHHSTPLVYDVLELLQPGRETELHADLSRRTGFDVIDVQLHRIDMLRDAAEITVVYKGKRA
jgi:hypothetical protein